MLRRPSLPSVDPIEAERRLREEPVPPLLVDVREVGEFRTVRAPGAILMPISTFLMRVGELPPERPLLVICHSGNRSASVTGYLIQSGRTDVTNVAGGMLAWERAGLPTRRGAIGPDEETVPR